MLKNVVFDVGGVLAAFDWQGYLHKLFHDEETVAAVHDAIWRSNLWNELNKNVVPEEVVFERMRDYDYKHRREIIKALTSLDQCVGPLAYAIPWLEELKAAGYNIYYLSNYSPLLERVSKDALGFILYTDGGLMSCDIHLVKPDRAIYSALCHIYKLNANECIFIDDNPVNVQAAEAYGMQGLVFKGYETTHKELAERLGTGTGPVVAQ